MSQKKKNNIIIGSLCAVVLLMAVGYAAFSSILNIKGTSTIGSNWNILITNVVSKNIVGSASNKEEPKWEALTATLKTNLVSPGDSIEYDVTIENRGNLNAKLDKITLTDSNNEAIIISKNGLDEGDTLNVDEEKTITIKVEYNSNITVQPNQTVSNITLSLDFSQGSGQMTINEPKFIEEGTYPKTVTIVFPKGCNGVYTCSYIKDDNEPVTVTSSMQKITFTQSGLLKAIVINGTKETEGTFNVMVQTPITITDLKSKITTTGDGLYPDSSESGRYIYRGTNPDNYVQFGEDIYRIIAIETEGTLKIWKTSNLEQMTYDPGYATNIPGVTESSSTRGTRYSRTSTDYCYTSSPSQYYGCNVWGSNTTLLNPSGTNITSIPRQVGESTTYNLPSTEAYLNTYLNETWYNTLNIQNQNMVNNHLWNVGSLNSTSGQSLATDISQEKAYKWRGKVGLINATDYIRASLDSQCTDFYAGKQTVCRNNNYLYTNEAYRTIAPYSGSYSSVWRIDTNGTFNYDGARFSYGVHPVIYLNDNINLVGEGTSNNPYIVVSK
ncbi:MAG: hypothetical protein HFH45_03150 [Bacilli bacterium]|nr:hypothetical protein [Bacilli bacterium]